LSNEVGELIWESTVNTNRLRLPDGINLTPDNTYYWKVEAKLFSDMFISSPVCYFTVQKK